MQYFKLHIEFLICVVSLWGLSDSSMQITYVGNDVNLNCGECKLDADNPFLFQITGPSHDGLENILITIRSTGADISPAFKEKITFDSSSPSIIKFGVKNVSKEDAGEYKCSQGSSHSCVSKLVLVGTPEKPVITSSGPAMRDENLTLTCSARSTSVPEGHGLVMEYHWQMNKKPVQDKKYEMRDGSLMFKVIKRDNGNKFTCVANEEGLFSEESDLFTVAVEYKPRKLRFVPFGDMTIVHVGKVLDIMCTADCEPRCTTSWLNEKTQQHVTNEDESLFKIEKINREDGGNYTCTVRNKHGRKSRTLFVDVFYNPIVESIRLRNNVTEHRSLVKESDSVVITCSIDSHPAPVVKWYTKNKTTPSLTEDLSDRVPSVSVQGGITHHQYLSRFDISHAQCSDSGMYYCQANNGIGNPVNGVSWELVVNCAPRIRPGSSFNPTFAKENGKPLIVKIEIEAFPRPSSYMLYLVHKGRRTEAREVDVKPVNVETAYLINFELMFRVDLKVGVESYSFEVENSEGLTLIDFNVTLEGPPLKSTELLAESGSDFIVLYWVPGFDGGFPQTFSLAYRTAEDEEWQNIILDHEVVDTEEENENMTAVVLGLEPTTDYDIRLYAKNVKGQSESTEIMKVTTLMAPAPVSQASAGMIAGICIALIVVIVIIIIIILVVMRRRKKKESDVETNVEYQKPFLEQTRGNADGSPGNADGSRGEVKEKSTEDLYTAVKNPKMVDVGETPYENVDQAKKNEKDKKPDETEDVAPLIPDRGYKPEESLPSNNNENNETPPKQDGLVYLELDLSKPTENTEEPVVHGDDAPTQYDTIDFSKKAEPEEEDAYENMEVKEKKK